MSLFGKSGSPAAEKEKNPTAPALARAEARVAYLGPAVRIQGELSADEDLVVEGRVDGRVSVSKCLRIGAAGQVNAEISGKTVVIAGHVVGNVSAVELVELLPSGRLEGNIKAPKIVVAEGATFKGNVDMGGKLAPPSGGPPPSAR
jgi:cytoskeletal protein CcmA (bactofilin family)